MGKSKVSEWVRISQAARQAGVSRQTLQYYIMIGLVEPTGRSPGGQQLFDTKCIERVRLVKQLNDTGYPLRAIREIFLAEKS